jgi:fatty acid-binding protein DegV
VRTYVRALDRIAAEATRQAEAWGGASIFVAHADRLDVGTRVADRLRSLPNTEVMLNDVGPVIGCHSGPGAIGVEFHRPLS